MCTHVPLKIRIWICVLCFVILIFLDCIAALNSVEGLLEILIKTNEGKTATKTDLPGQKETSKDNFVDTDLTNKSSNEDDKDKTAAILHVLMEMCVFCVLLALNTSALLGVRREKAYLMVPWLSVYLLGIFR